MQELIDFLNVFLDFFISLAIYVVRFNTNNKRHNLTYMLTRVFNFTTYDGTTINNTGNNF